MAFPFRTPVSGALASVFLLASGTPALAERLPITRYTMADGLAHDRVKCIVQDSRNFLWICTARGLSRFDGARFRTFTIDDGLPSPSINDILERRDGSYWVATNGGGVARLSYHGQPGPIAAGLGEAGRRVRIQVYSMGATQRADRVNTLYEDKAGQMWAGTDSGVFVFGGATGDSFQPAPMNIPRYPDSSLQIWDFVEDRSGVLWIATSAGLMRKLSDGRLDHVAVSPSHGNDSVRALQLGPDGRLWAAHTQGLIVFPDPAKPASRDTRWMRPASAAPVGPVLSLSNGGDDRIWVGSSGGLMEITGADSLRYNSEHGLVASPITALGQDREGNVWMGTVASGVMKLSRHGFTSYHTSDGLANPMVSSVLESPSGDIYVATSGSYIHRFDGRRFTAVRPNLPPHIGETGRRSPALLDHRGELWLATGEALYRFPAVLRFEELSSIKPIAVYTTANGLAENDVYRMFEDSRGDIWLGGWAAANEVLTKWDRKTGTFQRYSTSDGLPAFSAPNCFGEDRSGAVWIGFREGVLVRSRGNRFERVPVPGRTFGGISAIHSDRAGRLWIASAAGPARIDRPDADVPEMTVYAAAQGFLGSEFVNAITEDAWNRLYFGSTTGVDQVDVASGRVSRYTDADGLTGREMISAHRDRSGALWFITYEGLARFVPAPPRETGPPAIFITAVRVDGTPVASDDLGVTEITKLTLSPDQRQVQIEYFGMAATLDETLRYQHTLEGADSGWSAPTADRVISYPRLAPGRYTFRVRAIASGVESPGVASVSFTVRPPIWQRTWFVGLALVLVAGSMYGLARLRLVRQLELERIRTRIATDLHDDVGSSLSQIAILSEVVSRRAGNEAGVLEPLSKIAATSRELVDTMSDIVWAVSPHRDSFRDLIYRMRRFASDSFTAAGIAFRFTANDTEATRKIGADVRRDVYLMFKESVNNVVRHARCRSADVALRLEEGCLVLTVSDDGVGFSGARDAEHLGHGLMSLRERVSRSGGRMDLQSTPGQGTTLTFRIPLIRRAGRKRATYAGGDAAGTRP